MINYSRIYNPEIKQKFLEEEYPNQRTRSTYFSVFIQTADFEKDFEKDLCNFSYSEATELLMGLKKKSYKSVDVTQTILIKYVDWCINPEQGYSKTGINPFKLFTKSDLKEFVHQTALIHSFLTRERVFEIISELYNYTDKALIALLFEGVRGRTESENTFEELRNLRDIDVFPDTNELIITRNNGEKRVSTVDKRTIDIVLNAISQTDYHKNNGEAKGKFSIVPLKESNYVLRTIERRNDNDRIAIPTVNTKFKAFREYTGINFLNPTIIFQSGLLEKCERLEQKLGSLKTDDYRQIYKDLRIDDRGWYTLKEMYESYKALRS